MSTHTTPRADSELVGGTTPGHDLTVGAVRAAYRTARNRCEHPTAAPAGETICDACLPASAVILAIMPSMVRPTQSVPTTTDERCQESSHSWCETHESRWAPHQPQCERADALGIDPFRDVR